MPTSTRSSAKSVNSTESTETILDSTNLKESISKLPSLLETSTVLPASPETRLSTKPRVIKSKKPSTVKPASLANLQPTRLGRPLGSKNKITVLKVALEQELREQASTRMPEILEKAIDLALNGDKAMLKLMIEMHMSRNVAFEDESEAKPKVSVIIQNLATETAPTITVNEIKTPSNLKVN